jgi:quercetin dioxygenase-like cupin family protein
MTANTKTKRPEISPEQMERQRTARFAALEPSPVAYLDTRIPEHFRETFNVIGRGVTENADLAPVIPADQFNVTYIRCEPGTGAALHSHDTVEVFFIMEGQFDVIWGDGGERRTTLGKWDIISVPPGVMRGFINTGDGTSLLMAIMGGDDAGFVEWDPAVVERAKETGMERAEDGTLVAGT